MKKEKTQKKRIEYLDIARCLAMFCIIIGHLDITPINNFVFTFHIPLFLFISGYFFNPGQDFKTFFKHKFKSLIKPYLIVCAIICVVEAILAAPGQFHYTIFYWLVASLFGSGSPRDFGTFIMPRIGAIWFLLALFFALIVFKLLVKLPRYIRLILIILIVQLSVYSTKFFWLPLSLQPAGCFILFIYIGYLIRKYEHLIKFNRFTLLASTLLIISWIYCLHIGCGLYLVNASLLHGWLDILGSMGGCIVLVLVSKLIYKKKNLFIDEIINMGKNSIYILCVHLLELTLFTDILYVFVGDSIHNDLVSYFIFTNRIALPFVITLVLTINNTNATPKAKIKSKAKAKVIEKGKVKTKEAIKRKTNTKNKSTSK